MTVGPIDSLVAEFLRRALAELSKGSIALQGRKRYLRLEGGRVVPARSSVHLLILGTACPLSGRNSTYRLVQISETSSADLARISNCGIHLRLGFKQRGCAALLRHLQCLR
jgi:hypothetical protein